MKENDENYKDLSNNLSSYKNIFQYVYSSVFPEISLGKNLDNYETIRNEASVFERKPVKVDDFNKIEQKQFKERVEKQK